MYIYAQKALSLTQRAGLNGQKRIMSTGHKKDTLQSFTGQENLTDAQQKALGLHEISSNYSQEVSSLKLYLRNNSISFQDFKNEVRLNFSHIWNELNGNKLQTTELIRRIENISLHLISVENNWEKYNLKFKDCEGLIHHIENNVSDLENKARVLDQTIAEMCYNNTMKISDKELKENTTVTEEITNVIRVH
uniref:Uncharacterized protein n=1 Tax=Ceratitis capitata TaxID=7213 RepID=W8BHE4_CERCA